MKEEKQEEFRVTEGREKVPVTSWDLVLACLSVYVLGALTAEMVFDFSAEVIRVLRVADTALCGVFMMDFFRRLVTAKSKTGYLKWGWIDFLASIPMMDGLRWGRVVSLSRMFIILRAVRSGRVLLRVITQDPARAVVAMTALLTMLVMVGSSILMLHVERDGGNIKDGYDALWWSLTTVTTVGYGDRYPVTQAGRMVAGMLMALGIALYATFTAFISAKIMSLQERRAETEREAIHEEVRRLREEVAELTAALRGGGAGGRGKGDEKAE